MSAYRVDGKLLVSREDRLEHIDTQPKKTTMRVLKSQNCHKGMGGNLIVPLPHHARELGT